MGDSGVVKGGPFQEELFSWLSCYLPALASALELMKSRRCKDLFVLCWISYSVLFLSVSLRACWLGREEEEDAAAFVVFSSFGQQHFPMPLAASTFSPVCFYPHLKFICEKFNPVKT